MPYSPQNLELEAKKKLREAKEKWKEVKCYATKTQDTLMEQLADVKACGGNKKVEREPKFL